MAGFDSQGSNSSALSKTFQQECLRPQEGDHQGYAESLFYDTMKDCPSRSRGGSRTAGDTSMDNTDTTGGDTTASGGGTQKFSVVTDQSGKPVGDDKGNVMVTDGQGNNFVADASGNIVTKLDAQGNATPITADTSKTVADASLNPTVNPAAGADTGTAQAQKFSVVTDQAGKPVGDDKGNVMVTDGQGNNYVADASGNIVAKLDAQGNATPITAADAAKSAGTTNDGASNPTANTALSAEDAAKLTVVLDPAGNPVSDQQGHVMLTDAQGNKYMAEEATGKVLAKLDANGQPIAGTGQADASATAGQTLTPGVPTGTDRSAAGQTLTPGVVTGNDASAYAPVTNGLGDMTGSGQAPVTSLDPSLSDNGLTGNGG